MLESVPAEGVAQVTPALLLSFTTAAVSVTGSAGSTVVEDAEAETLMGVVPPVDPPPLLPQPETLKKARIVITNRLTDTLVFRPEGRDFDLDIWRPLTS